MFAIPEQFSTYAKAGIEAQLSILNAITAKAIENTEKLAALNIDLLKNSLQESTSNSKKIFASNDPQSLLAAVTTQLQPNAEKAISYGRQLAAIAAGTQSEYTKLAETQLANSNRQMIAMLDEVSKNAPVGSEGAIALVRSAIDNASAGYEEISKNTKQAVETIETNISAAVTQIAPVIEKMNARARK